MSKSFREGLKSLVHGPEASENTPPTETRPVSQETKRPVSQASRKRGAQAPAPTTTAPEAKYKTHTKASYYLEPELVRRLKVLAAKTGRELSDLADEAIRDLLAKHGEKR